MQTKRQTGLQTNVPTNQRRWKHKLRYRGNKTSPTKLYAYFMWCTARRVHSLVPHVITVGKLLVPGIVIKCKRGNEPEGAASETLEFSRRTHFSNHLWSHSKNIVKCLLLWLAHPKTWPDLNIIFSSNNDINAFKIMKWLPVAPFTNMV